EHAGRADRVSRLRSGRMTPMTPRQRVRDSGGGEAKEASKSSVEELRDALRRFAAERDWDQFHFPKNLAIALSVEAAERDCQVLWKMELIPVAFRCEPAQRVPQFLNRGFGRFFRFSPTGVSYPL